MQQSSRSGPVRSEAARMSILQSAADIVRERGYEHLTIEGIASRAGVGKQTVYRWWKSKSEIVAESLLEGLVVPQGLVLGDTGDLRRDLTAWLEEVGALLVGRDGEGLLRSLVAAAADNAEIGKRLRESFSRDASIAQRLAASVGQPGGLTGDAPVDELAEALLGVLLLRSIARVELDSDAIRRLLDAILGRWQA